MQSVAESLRRFVDPDSGPVTSVTSAPYPGFWRRSLWHSVAPLHDRWVPRTEKLQVLKYAGGGWSADREESQCKAVTEAVERWALRSFTLNDPKTAGLDADPTSNGFAALPASMGEARLISNAYCEAVERWALARIWDQGDFPVQEVVPATPVAETLLPASKGTSRHFLGHLRSCAPQPAASESLFFALCLVRTNGGGVLPGSACGTSPVRAQERAIYEARIHRNAFDRMSSIPGTRLSNLTEQRLRHFAEQPNGFETAVRRLVISAEPPAVPAPPVVFNRRLRGEWDPDVSVHRIIVEQPRHLHEGGLERFIV